MTRILLSLLAAFAIAIAVLAMLLRARTNELADLERIVAVKEALAQQAAEEAQAAVAALGAERTIREAAQKEVALLQVQLAEITKTRPNYANRPRPTDPSGLRESILRAVQQ